MSEFACPRCGSEFDNDDAVGEVPCSECGQLVSLPQKSEPVAAVRRQKATRFVVGEGNSTVERDLIVWTVIAFVGFIVFALLRG